MPQNSPDMETAKANIIEHIVQLDAYLQGQVKELATAGFSDRRQCSIAAQHFEEGCAALMRAVRERPSNDYGKQPELHTFPEGFTPPVDSKRNIADTKRLSSDSGPEWRDMDPRRPGDER